MQNTQKDKNNDCHGNTIDQNAREKIIVNAENNTNVVMEIFQIWFHHLRNFFESLSNLRNFYKLT